MLGALLLVGPVLGWQGLRALGTTHGHILFVGWFVQFAVGIAYWLLPRKKSPAQPYGYNEKVAFVACYLLNIGLLLRIIVEPLYASGVLESGSFWVIAGLGLSGLLQAIAGIIWVVQLWGRFFRRYSASFPAPASSKS